MNKGLDFKYDFSAADPDLLSGDCENLKRVLAGLLINSLKFTGAGVIGLILEKALPENKIDVKKCGFNFIVYDTGPGIGRAEQKNLFNPFVQGENSLNKKYGGLGLGLALSKKIVKKMGGTLICESTLNRGAKFIVSLDFEMPKADFFEKDQSKSPRVLVVDDLDGILNLLKYHLKKMGCNVWTASDGLQALEMVENNDFDIVFMDIEMPVMNGIEAAKRIRVLADPIKSSVPLIAMTSYRYEAITEKIDSSGINGYLYKPFEPDNLRVILTKWVKNGEKNDFSLHFQPFNILTVGLENNKYIDFNQGISRFGGNRPLYLRSLKNFLQALESLKADLIKIFSDSGRQGLKRKIHSIKGAAANLSLVQLFNEILEFEKILESDISDDHIISRINCFDDLINPLMDLRAEIAENMRNTKDIKTGHTVFFNTNSIGTKDYVISEQEILCMIESLEKHIQSFQPKPCFKVLDRLVLGIKDEFALVLIKKIRKNVSEYRFDAVETDFAEFKKWFVRKVFKDEH
jgi:signal transduction histidine kinase/ActR/RegA family two-component response regulator